MNFKLYGYQPLDLNTLVEDDLPYVDQILHSLIDTMEKHQDTTMSMQPTHPFDPEKYSNPLPLHPINPDNPKILNANFIQGMIDTSINPILKRIENLEGVESTKEIEASTYYRRIRKPKDPINRIFLVDDNDLVRFVFNAVEDVVLPSLIGWRLWSPDVTKPLIDYEANRTEGHIINRETIYKTLDDVEEIAMALIREHKSANDTT